MIRACTPCPRWGFTRVGWPTKILLLPVSLSSMSEEMLCFSSQASASWIPKREPSLRQKGHQLGQAAGSWLVHLYEEEGDRFFEKLNGLFSGLLIDKRQSKAFLFNDRYGVERIYWHETEDAVFFASEAKALLRVLPELREFDRRGSRSILGLWLYVGRSATLFRGVHLLPGALCLVF